MTATITASFQPNYKHAKATMATTRAPTEAAVVCEDPLEEGAEVAELEPAAAEEEVVAAVVAADEELALAVTLGEGAEPVAVVPVGRETAPVSVGSAVVGMYVLPEAVATEVGVWGGGT
jgi:hypothetical protein